MRRYVVGLAVVTPLALGAAWWVGSSHGDAAAARDLLGSYCTDCHNDADFTADLVIEPAKLDAIAADPEHWEKIVRKLRAEDDAARGPAARARSSTCAPRPSSKRSSTPPRPASRNPATCRRSAA